MAFLAALFFGFVPMFLFAYILYWFDHYEKEPLPLLVGVFAWGAVVAAGGSYVLNTLFGISVFSLTGSEALSNLTTGSISAPLFEETLKGLAVVVVFLVFRRELDSILDGIVYAGIAALGFAATENVLYIWRGYMDGGWNGLLALVGIRVILVGWQHPVYTSFIGMGLAIARNNRSFFVKILAVLAGWFVAMFTHSVHNTLAAFTSLENLTCFIGLFLDWLGVFFLFAVIIWAGWSESRNIARHLKEEMQMGIIQAYHYHTATSAWRQGMARITALFGGNYRATSRFYQVIGELAHKKQQLARLGEEGGNSLIIQRYREELAQLAPQVRS
ncbi:MAG: PrsW family intramembrane metalloprotease [Anaerolineales bacterium]|nr:PrsW family intramembrane metalloprotease [Anaerolineales bacterium]MCX7754285.1 PrsW family intramembrane metalloprotease [Anaerolineales bacterium]MDW8278680.1 PrsW family intramembrane metalloprotease [Anaerolineales bacterium]